MSFLIGGDSMTLGEVVHEYRTKNKLTMQEFADRCGLSKGYISMIEKGKHPQNARNLVPTFETIAKIAKGMNTDINTFVSVLNLDTLVTVNMDGVKHNQMPDELQILESNWDVLSSDDIGMIRFIASKYKK